MDLKDDFNNMLKRLEEQGFVLLQTPENSKASPVAAGAPAAR
jgi:hypothetical protein